VKPEYSGAIISGAAVADVPYNTSVLELSITEPVFATVSKYVLTVYFVSVLGVNVPLITTSFAGILKFQVLHHEKSYHVTLTGVVATITFPIYLYVSSAGRAGALSGAPSY